MVLFHSHTEKYLANHHRIFIWPWMGLETETHIGALDLAPKVQMSSRRREKMSKEVRPKRGESTHQDGRTDLMGAHQGLQDWE